MNGNRQNTSGQAPISPLGRTTLTITNVLAAGQTLPFPCTGTQFYVVYASNTISIKPSGGVFNPFTTGKGLAFPEVNAFNQIEVKNDNAASVVFQIVVGFDNFIDNTVIFNQTLFNNVAKPTYSDPVGAPLAQVDITDISGSPFTDINGKTWYAISRVAILMTNIDTGTDYLIQKASTAVSNGAAVFSVMARTAARLDISGNYRVKSGSNINGYISEIYNAIAA